MRPTRAQLDALAELLAERPLDSRSLAMTMRGDDAGALHVHLRDRWAVEHYRIDRAGLVVNAGAGLATIRRVSA